jgi:competence protein ComEA
MNKLFMVLIVLFCSSFTTLVVAGQVNVNKATAEVIAQSLKGIGPAKAAKIVELCQTGKPCSKGMDLLAVKGIGKKTLEKIKDQIVFSDK